jgi:hypothetical protein
MEGESQGRVEEANRPSRSEGAQPQSLAATSSNPLWLSLPVTDVGHASVHRPVILCLSIEGHCLLRVTASTVLKFDTGNCSL